MTVHNIHNMPVPPSTDGKDHGGDGERAEKIVSSRLCPRPRPYSPVAVGWTCACVAQLAALAHPVYADGKGTDACRGHIGVRNPRHPDWLCDGDRGRALVGGRLGAEATGYIVPPSTHSDKAQGLYSRAGLPLLPVRKCLARRGGQIAGLSARECLWRTGRRIAGSPQYEGNDAHCRRYACHTSTSLRRRRKRKREKGRRGEGEKGRRGEGEKGRG